MKLHQVLAHGMLAAHPEDAARVLDSLPEEDVLAVLAGVSAPVASETVRRLVPNLAAAILTRLESKHAGAVVEHLGLDHAANILRRMGDHEREALLSSQKDGLARPLRSLLRFPEGTAGSLMDPGVLALPGDLSVQEANVHIREHPENVRYNLYVVDRDQVLVGVLNLRELLLARRKDRLNSIANPRVLSISARAGRHEIMTHPAWRDARSVPVVDARGIYLGAVRYQTLRRLEEEQRYGGTGNASSTAEALGDLFSVGMGGVLVALAASVTKPVPGRGKHES